MDSDPHGTGTGSRSAGADAGPANPESGGTHPRTALWAAVSVGVSLVMGAVGNLADVSAMIDKFRQGGPAALAQAAVVCALIVAVAAAIGVATHHKLFTRARLRKAAPVVLSGCAGLLAGYLLHNTGSGRPGHESVDPPSAQTPLREISIPQGKELELTLQSGEANFDAPARWRLRAEVAAAGRCTFQLFDPSGSQRFVDGPSPLVHGRLQGSHQVRSAENCRIFVQGDDEQFDALPYVSGKTTQSGASPIFEADGPFTVEMGPGRHCGASLFRDDGGKEGQSIGAGSVRSFAGPGRFWVETETYDCRLEVAEK